MSLNNIIKQEIIDNLKSSIINNKLIIEYFDFSLPISVNSIISTNNEDLLIELFDNYDKYLYYNNFKYVREKLINDFGDYERDTNKICFWFDIYKQTYRFLNKILINYYKLNYNQILKFKQQII